MRNLQYLFLIFCLSIFSNVQADILLKEDFSDVSLPTDWTNTYQKGSVRWLFQTSPSLGSPSGNGYTVFDDDALGASVTPNEASLNTLSIDCSNRPNIYLTYSHFWFGVEFTHGYVEVSNDGGSTFTTVFDYNTVTRGSLTATQDTTLNISAIAGNQADVKIRFRYTDGGQIGKYWYLDDIIVHTGIDVTITDVVAPEYLGCSRMYNSAEPVTVRIFNNSLVPVSNIPVSCSVSGGTSVSFSETYTGTIPPQSFVDHTFPGTIDMSTEDIYFFDAATSLASDEHTNNDQLLTERWTVITRANLPYTEDFENGAGGWEFQNVASGGFLYGSVPFLSGPSGNGKSIYTDITKLGTAQSYLVSPTFDFSNVTEPHISLDIMHDLFGSTPWVNQTVSFHYSVDDGNNWVRLGSYEEVDWYSPGRNDWREIQDPWKRISRTLCELSGESCVKLRFEFRMYKIDEDQFAVDNIHITDGTGDDLHVLQFFPPEAGSCSGFTSTEAIGITLRNNTCRQLTNVSAQIDITGSSSLSFTEFIPGPIPAFSYYHHTFSPTMDMTTIGTYNLQATLLNNILGDSTDYYNDTAQVNNIIIDTRINSTISSLPYFADYNTNNDGWASNSIDPLQVLIRDTLRSMGGSEGEGNSWVSERKDGFQNVTRYNWVESPVFDLSTTTDPNLYMDIKEMFNSNTFGGRSKVEYTLDGGISWLHLGTIDFPNWYNDDRFGGVWNSLDTTWRQVQFPLCDFKNTCIQFRTYLFRDGYYEIGFAFDNFEIRDAPDAGIVEYLDPIDIGCLFSVNQKVTVIVYNWSCSPMTNVPVTFNVTGATTATLSGSVPGPIPSMDSVHYTFPGTYDMTPLGFYYLSAQISGYDNNLRNDTLKSTINVTRPKITTFPYTEDFEANDGYWIDTMETADVQFYWGSVPYLNGPEGNGSSWYIEIDEYNPDPVLVESPVFDFSKISEPYFYMDLKYDLLYTSSNREAGYVQYSTDGGYTWTRLGYSSDSTWQYQQYNRWVGSQPTWTTVYIDLCELSGEPCVQFRVAVDCYGSSEKKFAFDNIRITDGTGDDLQALQLYIPDSGNCTGGYTTAEQPSILIRNNFCRPLTNVPISITMTGPNNQVILDTIPGPVKAFGYHYYELDKTLDMNLTGEYSFDLEIFSNPTGIGTSCFVDTFLSNNIVTENRFSVPIISAPYFSDFESNSGGWASVNWYENNYYIRDTVHTMGGPEGNGISWILEDIRVDDDSKNFAYVESPLFDLTGFTNPQLSFDIKHYEFVNNPYTTMEFTLDNGANWTPLGTDEDPTWFNSSSPMSWTGIDTAWHRVQHALCDFQSQSCIGFRFKSYHRNPHYTSNTHEFAFDNFEVIDAAVDVSPIILVDPFKNGCLYSSAQQLKVAVYNWTCSDVFNVDVSTTVNGMFTGTFTGNAPGPIPSQDTVHVLLNGTFDMTPIGPYYFETTTILSTDNVAFNDVLRDTIIVTLPKVTSFPYEADFNTSDEQWNAVDGVPGREWLWDSLPYLNGSEGYGKSWYINNTNSTNTIYLESPVFDLSTLSDPYLTFDLKFSFSSGFYGDKVYMDYSIDGGQTWTWLGDYTNPNWYNAGKYWGGHSFVQDTWRPVSKSLCEVVGEPCVKFRMHTRLNTGNNGKMGFDNFKIRDIEEVAPLAIIAPIQDNCLYTGSDSVKVEIYNWSCNTVTNIPVTYNVTGPTTASVTEIIDSIPAESWFTYTFNTPTNLIPIGSYDFIIFTDVSDEVNRFNDTIRTNIVVDHLLINTFDFLEDFNADSGDGNWTVQEMSGRKFMWGVVPYLGGEEGRGNSWYTVGVGNSSTRHFLESPVYDFTNVTNPELFLDLKFDFGSGQYYRHRIEYSVNGTTWTLLGSGSNPNWYNRPLGWEEEQLTFTNYNIGLCHLIGEPCIKFRFSAATLTPNSYFAMDNWHLTNTTIDCAAALTYSCSGSEYELELTVLNRGLPCIAAPIINDIEVGYSVDGGAPIFHSYSGLSLAEDSSTVVIVPNTLIPNTTSVIKIWVFQPNGLLTDQVFENDTITIIADQWPSCNDHCSNAQFLTIGTTTTSQTSNATLEPNEDPTYSNCGSLTIENTVWYTFMTDAFGGMVTIDFENILCSPSANGIQVSIDELSGPPCQTSSLTNIYCNSPADTVPFGYGPVLLPPNTTYYIVVDGFAGNSCDFDIVLDGAIFNPNPSGAVTLASNVACHGDSSGSATVLASDGTLPYTYVWDNGETTPTATALSAGTHTVTVTEATGNSFTASVLLTEPTAITTTVTANTMVSCHGGDDGAASISATGGTPGYAYIWDSGATTSTVTGLSAGTHSVILTDTNGCVVVQSIAITSPTAIEVSTSILSPVSCNGLSDGSANISATGGIPNYTVLWDNGETTLTAISLQAGAHTVTLTDANDCSVVESVMITEPDALTASTTVISQVSCNGLNDGSASISANGGTPGYSILWDNTETTATAISLAEGMHTVTLTDANGCALIESVIITAPPVMTADTIIATEVSCSSSNDGTATILISGGTTSYTYTWSSGAMTATASGLSTGMYSVTAVDANGCSVVATISVPASSVPDLIVFTQTDEVSCGGQTDGAAVVSASYGHLPYSYLWDANAGNQTTASATGLAIGAYMVTVTDSKGCFSVDGVLIEETPCDYCLIADDNNTDICVVLTTDPNDPLAMLDCDGDGVRNNTECNDATDPMDPCDFVEASITEPITADQSGCINLCPDLTLTTTLIPGNISGLSPISVRIDVTELNLIDAGPGPITVRMPSDPRLTFNWNIITNPNWNYLGNTGIFHTFTYNGNNGILFGGSTESIFISLADGIYDPQGTEGRTTITAGVIPFSGGECTLFNNADAETLVYFQ